MLLNGLRESDTIVDPPEPPEPPDPDPDPDPEEEGPPTSVFILLLLVWDVLGSRSLTLLSPGEGEGVDISVQWASSRMFFAEWFFKKIAPKQTSDKKRTQKNPET